MSEQSGLPPRGHLVDACAPARIARKVHDSGVAKASLPARDSLALAVLAGAFMGRGAALSTLASTGSLLRFGVTRMAGFANNVVPVTLGNIAGGTLLVAGIYWFVYLRPERRAERPA